MMSNIHANDFINTAPTLIVGLGGLGCYIANTIYKDLSDEQQRHVEVMVMDTDVNELKEKMYDKLKNGQSVVQTSPSGIVMSCVERLDAQGAVEQWFPVDLLTGSLGYKQMTEGAAQVRSISRLAMLDTINSQRIQALNRKLENLLRNAGQQLQESCRVVMVNSIAGGTGSGSFLQLALYIREYFAQRNITNVTIRSFIAMPDIFIQNGDYNSEQLIDNVRANGYASLKEVDAVFAKRAGVSQANTQPFYDMTLEYKPNQTQAIAIEKGTPPFDVVTLFDYSNLQGRNIGHKNNYIANMIDTIRLHLFSPLVGRGGIASQTDNLVNHHVAHGNRSNYAGSGVASLEYPVDDMLQYGALRWATDGISSEWLEIDEQITDEIHRAEQARKDGVFMDIPNEHQRFCELVRQKAEISKPAPFYRNIYNDVHLLNEHGERTEIKHLLWLRTINKHIDDVLQQAIQEKSTDSIIPILSQDALLDPDNVEDQVKRYEYGLERYLIELEKRVQNAGLAMAKEMMWSPYQRKVDVNPQQDIQLNTWILSKNNPMHPLAVRYFLGESIQTLTQALAQVEARKASLERAIANYAHSYDDPRTETEETAMDIARQKAKFWNRLKGDLKRFAEEYADRSGVQKRNIEHYAKAIVQADVYANLLGFLEDFAQTWRLWFHRLEQIVNKNQQKIALLAVKHEKEHNPNPTVIYVCASKHMKEKIWETEKVVLTGQEFPTDISRNIYTSIYREKAKQYIDQQPPLQNMDWVETLFKEHVLAWCQVELAKSPSFNMDVSSAIRKEFELDKQSGLLTVDMQARDRLQQYMNQLDVLAVPLVNLQHSDKGQDFKFICLHPVAQQVWSQADMQEVIGSPFVHDGFSKYRISKLVLKYGLLASDLRTFADDDGIYRMAYEKRIAQSRAIPRQSTSPHLDYHWDSPAFLPEMSETQQAQALDKIYFATLLNQSYALAPDLRAMIFPLEYDLKQLWHQNIGQNMASPIPAINRQACDATLYNLVDVFAVNYHLVPMLLAQEQQRVATQHTEPEQAPYFVYAIDLIEQIYAVAHQSRQPQLGQFRQQKLLIALLTMMQQSLTERYTANISQSKFAEIRQQLAEQVVDLEEKTSSAYVQYVKTVLDNFQV